MNEDKIVEEVRKVRQEHAEKFNFDLDAIFDDLKKQEKKSKRKLVTFASRPAVTAMAVNTTVGNTIVGE